MLEGLGDLWVHVDQEVVLVLELLVPRLDVVVHPVLERLSVPRVDDVRQPLAGQQVDLSLVREVLHELRGRLGPLDHALDRDPLVLGAVDGGVLALLDACKV